ncbi:hypothetical protein ACOMHN_021520 [Nucella lapillus]
MSMMRARVRGHRWVYHPAAAVMKARVPGQWVDCPAAVVMEAREQGRCWIDHPAVAVIEARVQGRHWVDRPSVGTAVIAGVVVAVLVIVAIVVIVVCVVMHHKSNEVIRINQAAHSRRGDTANITILQLSSNNPYEHAPPPQPHMMTTTSYPNQPTTLPPPDVPFSGFHPNGPHPNPAPFLAPSAKAPPADPDPCFPPEGDPGWEGSLDLPPPTPPA